jgi:hypothetical protein
MKAGNRTPLRNSGLATSERSALAYRVRATAREHFGMEVMAQIGEGARSGCGDGSGARPGHTLVWIVRFSRQLSTSHDQLISWLLFEQRTTQLSFGGRNAGLIEMCL